MTSLPPSPLSITRMTTRSQTGALRPKHFPGFKLYHFVKHPLHIFHAIHLPPEARTYHQAASKSEWHVAMGSEFDALMANGGHFVHALFITMWFETNGYLKFYKNKMGALIGIRRDWWLRNFIN